MKLHFIDAGLSVLLRCIYAVLPIFAVILLLSAVSLSSIADAIRVGVYPNPPKVFLTPGGDVSGVFPEVLSLIADKCGWKLDYVFGSWTECMSRLESGEIDLLPDIATTAERLKKFDFSEKSVLENWGMVYTRKGGVVESLRDLDGRVLAVMRGSSHTEGERGVKSLIRDLGITCRFVESENYEEVLALVGSGAADAGVVNRIFGLLYASRYGVVPTPIIFNPQPIRFAVKKGDARGHGILNQIDRYLDEMNHDSNSELYRILVYYLAGGRQKWRCAEISGSVDFTPQEQAWIEEHPVVRIGVDPGFAPFEFVGKRGRYNGVSADYLKLVEKKSGLKFKIVSSGLWSDSLRGLRSHDIDMLPCVGKSSTREKFMAYSEPYLGFARVIVTRKDSRIKQVSDLSGKRVGVQKNSSHHMYIIENTKVKPILYDSFDDVLLAVSRSEVDAAVGNLAVVSHFMANLSLTNLKVGGFIDDTEQLYFGVRKDWPELVLIMNHVMASITLKQRDEILSKWITLVAEPQADLDLTPQEKKWLLEHPRISVGWDVAWAPIEYVDKAGVPRGIAIDYLKEVERKLGIHFEMNKPQPWQEVDAKSCAGELDMLSCVAPTAERLSRFNYTAPYLDIPVVIFGYADMPYVRSVADLGDYRIAVVEGYATDQWVSRDFPHFDIVRTKTVEEALRLLHRRRVDAFVGNVVAGNYYLSRLEYSKIKIVGETGYEHKQSMAVRKEWPIFAGILQKAIDAIPEAKKTSFYRKWVWLRYEHRFDYYFLSKVIMGCLIFVLMLFFWNRRLAQEIKRRKLAEQSLLKRERELKKSYSDLKNAEELRDNLIHMFVHDMRTPLTSISCVFDLLDADVKTGELNESIAKSLLIGQCSANNLASMVQAILDINRLENDCMPLKLVDCELKSICRKVIELTRVQADYARQRVIVKGDEVQVTADVSIIQRVVVNLVVNAIHASPENAEVIVYVSQNGGVAQIEVLDRGCGISDELREVIFDKFKVGLGGKVRGSASVGLGLAFCKLAVETHGGKISVEARDGGGSLFRVELPPGGDSGTG
jgi:ABC-type amino acid transport substrate-binding protein/nitrogen-specific signal transduction histidine kinase